MRCKTVTKRRGFTLTELAITIAMSIIIVLGIGVVLVDSQRGWYRMYNRVHSDVVTDASVARRTFDVVVRKSTMKQCELGNDGRSVEVYYEDSSTGPFVANKYARFFVVGEELQVVYGDGGFNGNVWEATSASSPAVLARNVEFVRFSDSGACVEMILRLDNGNEEMTVTTSAIRHNR